jgi:ribosomal protein L11 methyltransferase
LVLANILAGPLKRLAPELAQVVAERGALVLSGLLARDVPGVLSVYRAHNFGMVRHDDRDGWSTLLLRRHVG